VDYRPVAAEGGVATAAGVIDYRLARRAVLNEFRRGRLSTNDICDAHPELCRAAVSCSRPTTDPCPVCEQAELVNVIYVFGPGLPRSGRCITTPQELASLHERATHKGQYACYVVEVCTECRWNHLTKVFPLGARPAG
jgi:hypothetical protein